jgi:hypothetical protein
VCLIVPLSEIVVWQDPQTHDAVLAAGVAFVATIGGTGAAFADLLETEDAARSALVQYRSPGFIPLPGDPSGPQES